MHGRRVPRVWLSGAGGSVGRTRNVSRAIAVSTRGLAKKRKALRTAMGRVMKAKASAAPRTFVPAKAQASGRMLGRALAGTGDRETDAKLQLLCSLQL